MTREESPLPNPPPQAGEGTGGGVFNVVIPARYGSTRLPGKVLREVAGRPLLRYVFDAAVASGAEAVIVATEDERVRSACEAFGARALMTSPRHASGTDRVNEVAQTLGWPPDAIVVNLQGDEPLMPPALVRQAAVLLAEDPAADVATLCHPIRTDDEWLNPNVVKVVMDTRGDALYFSRAPIPWPRGTEPPRLPAGLALRHIGIYAYRARALARFAEWPAGELEQCEALEQLRALAHGLRIRVAVSDEPPPRSVDTAEDLQAVTAILTAKTPSGRR